MKIEDLRAKIEEEEKDKKSDIDNFREDINKKELEDICESKDVYEEDFIAGLQQDLEGDAKGFVNKIIFKITKLIKRIGLLSIFVDYIYKQEEFFDAIQSKLGWDKGDEKEYERNRMIVVALFLIVITISFLFIFLIFKLIVA